MMMAIQADYQKAVKYSILYMKAVKALQEAMTRIETLEAKARSRTRRIELTMAIVDHGQFFSRGELQCRCGQFLQLRLSYGF